MRRSQFLLLATIILLAAACLRLSGLSVYPPGPHYDEAVNLLVVRSIIYGGARFFPMVEAYQGREVLYFYLSAPMVTFVNDGMFAFHLTNVFANLITIAASMALGKSVFRGKRGLLIGAVVGMLMTFSFHQVWLGRQAFRAVTLPMMQALALLFLFWGMRARRGWGWLVLAGFFAGGALYTYNSSRLFPIWLGLGLLVLVIASRFDRRTLVRAIVFGISMTVTAAPMIAYAIQRPDIFFGRLGEVTQAGKSITLAESIVVHLKMFFIEGDPYYRYNDPGRPYFTLPEGLFLLIGLGVAGVMLFRRNIRPVTRMGYALVLMSPLMVIPSVISVGGLPPSNMRSLGMVPLIFLLVAVGVEAFYSFVTTTPAFSAYRARIASPRIVSLILIAVLVVGSVGTGVIYFQWASRADVFFETDADLSLAAKWAVENREPGEQLYVAARDKGHPTVMIEPLADITWIGTDSLFLPAEGDSGLYIFPHSAPPSPEFEAILEPYQIEGLPTAPDGERAFAAYRLTRAAPQTGDASSPQSAYLRSEGVIASPILSGAGGWITTRWAILAPPDVTDFTPLVQIEDDNGTVYSRGDAYMTETDRWRVGETIFQRLHVDIPSLTPPGEYRVRIAWVGRSSDRYASYIHEDGTQAGIWADVGTISIERSGSYPPALDVPAQHRIDQTVTPSVSLIGYDGELSTVRPGDLLPLTLYWHKTEQSSDPLMLTASLRPLDGANEDVLLWEGQPVDNRYPSDQWMQGEVVADHVRWQIPVDALPGAYQLILMTGAGEIVLGDLLVADVPRLFDPPPVAQMLDVVFDSEIALTGYTIRREGEEWVIEMVWRAEQTMGRELKVFVHLVSDDGTILSQRDSMPQDNLYPTTLWLPGEYIVDTYRVPVSAGESAFRIGLYDPETGMRLIPIGLDSAQTDFIKVDLNPT